MTDGGKVVKIGTRRSQLALWQARHVAERLEATFPQVRCELVEISTSGDQIQNVPLSAVDGKAFFTKEIDDALLDGRADVAVHSLKDLPTEMPNGISLAAVTEREDVRDAWLSISGKRILELEAGSRVATSSRRRQAWVKQHRPDLQLVELRGNVPTRVAKLQEGQCDAIILAMAGLNRLELSHHVTEPLSVDLFPPAPGQGAVGICVRSDDNETFDLVHSIGHVETAATVNAERQVLALMGGGCHTPLGVTASIVGSTMRIAARLANADLDATVESSAEGSAQDAPRLVGDVVASLQSQVSEHPQFADTKLPESFDADSPVVIVTRAEAPDGKLSRALRNNACAVLNWPVIETAEMPLNSEFAGVVRAIDEFDWLVITSPRAATALIHHAPNDLPLPKLALVGQESERRLAKAGFVVNVQVRAPSARQLADALTEVIHPNERALFLAGNLAPDTIPQMFANADVKCRRVDCYQTRLKSLDPKRCREELGGRVPSAVSFSSPSAVRGFDQALPAELRDEILGAAKVFAMGESTADAVRALGGVAVQTDAPSLEGFAEEISESLASGGST